MLAKHLTGCPNPQSTSFRPFRVSIHHPMGCPIPLGSRFVRFAFRLATLWIAPFHKVVASLHLSTPRSPRRLLGMTLMRWMMYRSRKRMNPSPCAAMWPLVGRRWRRESVPTVRAARSGRSWRSEIVGCAQPHPWLLSTIATAIATWLGALSRSHGRRAHRRGPATGPVRC